MVPSKKRRRKKRVSDVKKEALRASQRLQGSSSVVAKTEEKRVRKPKKSQTIEVKKEVVEEKQPEDPAKEE